jgi:hypothetical protein
MSEEIFAAVVQVKKAVGTMQTDVTAIKTATVRVPKTINNACSVASFAGQALSTTVMAAGNVKAGLSGVMSANTFKTLLSVSGPGQIDVAAITTADTTSRTIKMRITLDGVTAPYAFDPGMSAAITAADTGIMPVGSLVTGGVIPDPVVFNTSCLIEIASSLGETDKIKTYLKYRTY